MGDAPGHLSSRVCQSLSRAPLQCLALYTWAVSAGELVTCGDKGAAWHGPAHGPVPAGANPPLLWSPEPLQGWNGVAASCRYCRSYSSLSSPNPSSLQTRTGGKGPVCLLSCTLGAVPVGRKCGSYRGNHFSQHQSGSQDRSLGGDGGEAACIQHQDWKPQRSCSHGWSVTFSWPHPFILLSISSLSHPLLPASHPSSSGYSAALSGTSVFTRGFRQGSSLLLAKPS